jgi:hypothetical protein
MSYEAAILSADGDDFMLVKSFITAADEAIVQWYSLLSPGVIHGWDDLKQRILSNFKDFSIQNLQRATFSHVSRRTRSPSKITLVDSFTSGPRHQMCWTPSPLMLQLWV